MTSLFSEEARRDPYPLYERLRAGSPVLHDPRTDSWMLFDYESVRRALHDPGTFGSAVSPPPSPTSEWLVFADPPRHTKLRALVMRAFTPRSVAGLERRIRQISRGLLDGTVERGEMDLVADYAVPLPLMVIAEMLGAPVEDRPRFRRWTDAIAALAHTVSGSPGRSARCRSSAPCTRRWASTSPPCWRNGGPRHETTC